MQPEHTSCKLKFHTQTGSQILILTDSVFWGQYISFSKTDNPAGQAMPHLYNNEDVLLYFQKASLYKTPKSVFRLRVSHGREIQNTRALEASSLHQRCRATRMLTLWVRNHLDTLILIRVAMCRHMDLLEKNTTVSL